MLVPKASPTALSSTSLKAGFHKVTIADGSNCSINYALPARCWGTGSCAQAPKDLKPRMIWETRDAY